MSPSSCVICGDREPTLDTSEQQFQHLYKALKVEIEKIPEWELEKDFLQLCSSCSQISDQLSTILDQLRTLEQDYLTKTQDLKKLIEDAELKDYAEDSALVKTFRKLALGLTSQKRGRGRPKKQKKCRTINLQEPILTLEESPAKIANVLSESELSHAEESYTLRPKRNKKTNSKRNVPSSDEASFISIVDSVKSEIKQELESAHEFSETEKVEVDDSFEALEVKTQKSGESASDALDTGIKRSTRKRTTRLKVNKQWKCETDDTDEDPDFSIQTETARLRKRKRVSFKLSEDENGDDNQSSDDYTDDEKAHIRWKEDKKSGKLWYDGVEVTKVANGLECSICQEVTPFDKTGHQWKHKQKMKDHIIGKHLGNFVCLICNKKLSKQKSLDLHIKTVHEKSVNFPCNVCAKPFTSSTAMRRHCWNHQSEEEKKAAIAAGKKQGDNGDSKLRMISCETCGKIFKGPYNLRKHQVIHNDSKDRQKHMCQVCGAIYSSAETLRSHIKIKHDNNNRLQWLQCPQCDKKFPQPGLLEKHLRSHTGEKPYVCEHCGKGFIQGNLLKVHLLKHQNIRPFQCSHCPMAFYRSYHMRRHIQAYHDNPNPPTKKQPYRSENGTRKPPQKRVKKPKPSQALPASPATNENESDSAAGPSSSTTINIVDPRQILGLMGIAEATQNYNFPPGDGPYPFYTIQ